MAVIIPDYLNLDDLSKRFPATFSKDRVARAQTIFLKKLSVAAHAFYGGKLQMVPKAGLYGFGWFGVWYTPGVSAISTAIRENPRRSYELSSRGQMVAVVSDSTRVLGDGDCTPSGGLGVMEGKAFLMYYLGGISAVPLCINTHTYQDCHKPDCPFDHRKSHDHSPEKLIEFVRMAAPSFGAVNLEDIQQPNCFAVLDRLQDCGIPVWHDDAQGTACVTLAGMINALKITGRNWHNTRFVFYGAGASNTTIVRLMLADGLDPKNVIVFDSKGGLHTGRDDVKWDLRFYRKWEICQTTNPQKVDNIEEAMNGADVLVALSKSGPGVVPKRWIERMNKRAIVFACANPVPEIYPHEAKEAGAEIVATGRSDFPNQINNSLGFPGILKGVLLVNATRISDSMAIAAARCLARVKEEKGMDSEHIVSTMDDVEIYPRQAADVAMQAVHEGLAQRPLSREEVYRKAKADIGEARKTVQTLMDSGLIQPPPADLIEKALQETIAEVEGT